MRFSRIVAGSHDDTANAVVPRYLQGQRPHYNDVMMSATASQIISLTIICSSVYAGADQRKHQSSVSLAFVWGIHRWPVNSPHKWPVTRKCFHLMTSSCRIVTFQERTVASCVEGRWWPLSEDGGVSERMAVTSHWVKAASGRRVRRWSLTEDNCNLVCWV